MQVHIYIISTITVNLSLATTCSIEDALVFITWLCTILATGKGVYWDFSPLGLGGEWGQ